MQSMGRRARALDRRLRPARHLGQHFQCLDDGFLPDVLASDRAKPMFAMGDAAVPRGDGEMHEADRLARRAAARSGDAGDGDRKIGIGMFERTERHRDRDLLADRAKGLQLRRLDAEHGVLGVVGVSDEAAVHPL